jgi:hypothetical protein
VVKACLASVRPQVQFPVLQSINQSSSQIEFLSLPTEGFRRDGGYEDSIGIPKFSNLMRIIKVCT